MDIKGILKKKEEIWEIRGNKGEKGRGWGQGKKIKGRNREEVMNGRKWKIMC